MMTVNYDKFKHFISLGYFCDVATDIERLGLRDGSYPFDWLITNNFKDVIKEIENNFDTFLIPNKMYQIKEFPNRYRNIENNFDFYHDFSEYQSFNSQIKEVENKYKRRINRFYNSSKQPTLFIRYINLENNNQNDYLWIKANEEYIINTLKKYNDQNEIVYLATRTLDLDNLYIIPDEGNDVCHNPIFNNKDLYNKLSYIDFNNKDKNISFFNNKQQKKKVNELSLKFKRKLLKVYMHSKQI